MTEEMISKARTRIPRWAWITGSIFLALLLLAIVPHLVVRYQINAELRALKADGYPTTLDELDAWYPQPKGENAASVLNSAFTLYSTTNLPGVPVVSGERLPPLGEPLPADMKAKTAAYLADNAKALELLHKAATTPECRFPIQLQQGTNLLLSHVSKTANGSGMLELEAVLLAENGKTDDAAESLEAMFGLARSLLEEPLLLSQQMRMAMCSDATRATQEVLSRTVLSDAHLQKLAALAAAADDSRSFERAMVGEALLWDGIFCDPRELKSMLDASFNSAAPGTVRFMLYRLCGIVQRDRLENLRWMRRMVADARRPLPEAIRSEMDFRQEMNDSLRTRALLAMPLAASPVGWLPNAFVNRGRGAARLRALQASCAVERYRSAHGRLPEKLDNLLPEFLKEIPADPFDGQPLRYKRGEKAGYVIYSIGANMQDDGGDDKGLRDTGDIAFHVNR